MLLTAPVFSLVRGVTTELLASAFCQSLSTLSSRPGILQGSVFKPDTSSTSCENLKRPSPPVVEKPMLDLPLHPQHHHPTPSLFPLLISELHLLNKTGVRVALRVSHHFWFWPFS